MIARGLRLFVLLAASAAAWVASAAELKMTPAEQAAVERAVTRGRLIFEFDRAAWVSTDEIRKRPDAIERMSSKEGGGWIVVPTPIKGALKVIYLKYENGQPIPVFSDLVVDGVAQPGLLVDPQKTPWTAAERRMVDAMRRSRAFEAQLCTPGAPNTVVMPPPGSEAPVEVYLLSPVADGPIFPASGHYLLQIDGTGAVVSQQRFGKDCLNLDPRRAPGGLQGVAVSSLLSDTPTEIHVYLAHLIGQPLYVISQKTGALWEVNGDEIRLVKR